MELVSSIVILLFRIEALKFFFIICLSILNFRITFSLPTMYREILKNLEKKFTNLCVFFKFFMLIRDVGFQRFMFVRDN